ncbi:hypothetical protein [Streptomyces sp. NPDC048606]|uniref:hypothetical protein n=1 Tax=Streptomyces sp. NPDC048606 TaxID=3154726 RepID=UPI0034456B54
MNHTRTTPPRPVDVTAVFPELAPLARTATRLHPRPGAPSPRDSSIGGPLLWPADEPWPRCDAPHDGGSDWLDAVRVNRRALTRAARNPDDPRAGEHTTRERAILEGIDWDVEVTDAPVPLLPLAQLYVRDVPALRLPRRAGVDLLQVLWCPFEHPEVTYMPKAALFWRSAAEVTEVLASPPEPPAVECAEYVPEPCLLAPEEVTEYPDSLELDVDLRLRLGDWNRWRDAGPGLDASYAPYPEAFYGSVLSVAPGWKVGGWAPWGYTDPDPRFCAACATRMEPLLTIDSFEWDGGNRTWIPYEDRAAAEIPTTGGFPEAHRPTAVQIGGGYKQQLYVCPADPEHPHAALMQ